MEKKHQTSIRPSALSSKRNKRPRVGMEKKHQTSLRLSPDVERLLVELARKLNLTKSTTFELAIRDYAARKGVR